LHNTYYINLTESSDPMDLIYVNLIYKQSHPKRIWCSW